jgi:hypothetical protein
MSQPREGRPTKNAVCRRQYIVMRDTVDVNLLGCVRTVRTGTRMVLETRQNRSPAGSVKARPGSGFVAAED